MTEEDMIAGVNDLVLERWFRLRNSGKLKWRTRDGRLIPLKDMTDEHLLNAIRHEKAAMERLGNVCDETID